MSTVELFYAGGAVDDLDITDRQRQIAHLLSNYDCEVTFTKVDGTVRTMPCTLRADALPARDTVKLTEAKEPTRGTISVWCLDKNSWRSFRIANVQRIKVLAHD